MSKTAITRGTFGERRQIVEAILGVGLVIPELHREEPIENFPSSFKDDIPKVFEIPGALRRDFE